MRLFTVLVAVGWIMGVAWLGWTSLPQLPLDVSANDPATMDALRAARMKHAVMFGAAAIMPALLIIWFGRWLSR